AYLCTLSLDDALPISFPVVGCVEDLWDQLRREKRYDDDAFRSRYCQYDGKDAASLLCRRVLQKESCVKTVTLPDNGRDNVLIYRSEEHTSELQSRFDI